MKTRTIYTLKMAQALINQGFDPVRQAKSAKDITKSIWLFEETADFNRACEEYISNSKTHAKPENPDIAKFSRRLIAKMFFKQKLPAASIAKITGKSENEINDAIYKQFDLYRLFAIARMDDEKLKVYMETESDEKRMRMVLDILEQSEFDVYGGGKVLYSFPGEIAGEVSGNA